MHKWLAKRMSDEALMVAYAKGNIKAFEVLYLRHKGKLHAFLRRQCDNQSIAEELTHDAWLGVINQADVYLADAKFTTWLYRIAHNRLIDYWRKHGSPARLLTQELNEQISTGVDNATSDAILRDLLNSLEELPVEQIEAVLLKIEGFSLSEIAEITQTKHETVKSRLRYATQRLRGSMELYA